LSDGVSLKAIWMPALCKRLVAAFKAGFSHRWREPQDRISVPQIAVVYDGTLVLMEVRGARPPIDYFVAPCEPPASLPS
jgi:hypothetical protein